MSDIMNQFKKPSEPATNLISGLSPADRPLRHRSALEGHDGAESTTHQPCQSCANGRAGPCGLHWRRRPAGTDCGGGLTIADPVPSCDRRRQRVLHLLCSRCVASHRRVKVHVLTPLCNRWSGIRPQGWL
jgi:hypothetical protein